MSWTRFAGGRGLAVLLSVAGVIASCEDSGRDCASAACRDGGAGGGDRDADAAGPALEPIARELFFLARARAYCAGLEPCCREAGYESISDVEACAQGLAGEYESRVGPLDVDYDANAGARCVASYDGWLDDCDPVGADAVLVACRDVFIGTHARGAECSDDAECAPIDGARARCQRIVADDFEQGTATTTSACVIGRAAPEDHHHASLGDSCTATCRTGDLGCWIDLGGPAGSPACFVADGLHCADGECRRPFGEGEPCANDYSCAAGLQCDFAALRCALVLEEGAACTSVSLCGADSLCWSGPTGGQCGLKHATGEVCDSGDKCLSGNCVTEECVRPSIPNLMEACYPSVTWSGFWHF